MGNRLCILRVTLRAIFVQSVKWESFSCSDASAFSRAEHCYLRPNRNFLQILPDDIVVKIIILADSVQNVPWSSKALASASQVCK